MSTPAIRSEPPASESFFAICPAAPPAGVSPNPLPPVPPPSAPLPPVPVPAVPLLDVNRQNGPLADEIRAAIDRVCTSGRFVLGPDCEALEREVAAYCRANHAVGSASGSDALLLAFMALSIGPGDEVIVPSYTFFATASAVWRLGARPVFADICPATYNIDPAHVAALVTRNTRAIVPVHLFGQCADMTMLSSLAARHGLPIVEDAAQAIGAEWAGRRAGSMGLVGCLSFYPTKNLGGFGDGGMMTAQHDDLAARLRLLATHGMSPRYYHKLVGVNSRLDTIQAAVLRVKLPHLDRWTARRSANARRYAELFAARGLAHALGLPSETAPARHGWNQYVVRIPDGRRDALRKHLADAGIGTEIYYPVPLHLQECFATLGYREGSLPETERAARETLALPIYAELTQSEQEQVVARIADFFTSAAPRRIHGMDGPNYLKHAGRRSAATKE
jgi:dTDP-4-amino-4,6-dideoxygalactose transaminase